MELERFIFSDVTRAQQWVEACARSLNIARVDASIILAHLCGFPSWDHMVQNIGIVPPTACDEAIEEKQRKSRKARYIKLLTTGFSLDKDSGSHLIENLSPSSSKPFKVLALDVPDLKVSREKENPDASDRGEDEESGENIDFDRLLEHLAGEGFDHETMSDILNSLRLSGETYPDRWFNILTYLGWNIPEETFDEDAELGEPAMICLDDELGEVPVYLCATVRSPYDDGDETTALAMTMCMNDFDYGEYGETALLIWSGPAYKKIRKKYYCHIGMMAFDGEWIEILINKDCTSPGITFNRNCTMETINSGHPDLIDEDKFLFEQIVHHLAGLGDPTVPQGNWHGIKSKSPTGWNHKVVLPVDPEDAEDD